MLEMQILSGNASHDGKKIQGERYVKEERELFRKLRWLTKGSSIWSRRCHQDGHGACWGAETQGTTSVSSYEETKHKETRLLYWAQKTVASLDIFLEVANVRN